MTDTQMHKRPVALAIFLIAVGIVGWYAAFALTIEKFDLLIDPEASASCDFSILVQCKANLTSWQGSLFGFPNPILGLGAWVAPIVVGAALLAGARLDRWFWIAFNVGIVGALGFVVWLIKTSIFELGTLCPWCMVTWSVTIPLFWALTFYNLREGIFTENVKAKLIGRSLFRWVPAITIGSYVVVAIVAQVRLDFIAYL
ncbi:MAG: vitamin K epoxide reductase family protein [Microbacteriaceae bacterium]